MSQHESFARSFGSVAAAYDRGRPGYPRAAAAWLVGETPCRVLELGAGTGQLTEQLVALGHHVVATDVDPAMLELLSARLPDVPAEIAAAERLPFATASFDVVVTAQAFHWFDAEAALPEISRVLVPGGRFAAVWNAFDTRVPWVRRLSRMLGDAEQRDDLADPLLASPLLQEHEAAEHRHWHVVDERSLLDMAASRSGISTLGDAARERVLADVRELYSGYGRGMDGMQLPLVARCFVSQAAPRPPEPEPAPEPAPEPTREPVLEAADTPEARPTEAGTTETGTHTHADDLEDTQSWHPDEWDEKPPAAERDDRMVITTGSLPRIEVALGSAPQAALPDEGLLLIDLR
ncbi:class I SAM-dependent methyltransferase [Nocardioides sp. GY 10127]|uniref:class I SAM-dependent methyltransferase n=1 Tax=Nocardioides sp. GY 10127 TaxID=2569762 RepID=UPI0010A7F212|nr:class I SAM-dependent methyltransferase [Nocardioides sp. GY 10127]TIC83306.1 class I SAM-dependent methyltransferase [Nocardioides sp. GY 10127]